MVREVPVSCGAPSPTVPSGIRKEVPPSDCRRSRPPRPARAPSRIADAPRPPVPSCAGSLSGCLAPAALPRGRAAAEKMDAAGDAALEKAPAPANGRESGARPRAAAPTTPAREEKPPRLVCGPCTSLVAAPSTRSVIASTVLVVIAAAA